MTPDFVEVTCGDGLAVRHRPPGPYRREDFGTGFSAILNGNGINWIRFPSKPGAVLFCTADPRVDEVVDLLNDT